MLDYIVPFLANLSGGPRFTSLTLAQIQVLALQKLCICPLYRGFLTTRGPPVPTGENLWGKSMSHPRTFAKSFWALSEKRAAGQMSRILLPPHTSTFFYHL